MKMDRNTKLKRLLKNQKSRGVLLQYFPAEVLDSPDIMNAATFGYSLGDLLGQAPDLTEEIVQGIEGKLAEL